MTFQEEPLDISRITALHEAGHAVVAMATGLMMESVSIERDEDSLGRVILDRPPRPLESDCRPNSLWFNLQVRNRLAGDRAVRTVYPSFETVGGGRTSDYVHAVRLIEVICGADQVEARLDRVCKELDDFLAKPEILEQLDIVTDLLLDRISIDAKELHALLYKGLCGALNPEGTYRCNRDRHRLGKHHFRFPYPATIESTIWWDGLGPEDRTLKSKRSALHRRVLRVVEPGLYPPLRNDPRLDDLPVLTKRASDRNLTEREQRAALRRMAKLITQRPRQGSDVLPLPSTLTSSTRSELERHDQQCGRPLTHADDEYWCPHCAFEFRTTTQRRPRRHYQAIEMIMMRPLDNDEPTPVATPGVIFATAGEAANYLRLLRETDSKPTYVVRRSLMKTPPRNPR